MAGMNGVYLVTDRKVVGAKTLEHAIKEALECGVRAIQLREKDMETRGLLNLARRLREITSGYNALFIVNDRPDIALLTGADGVHLGQHSFSPADIRPLLGNKKLIGVSTHTLKEALEASRNGADFITFGPVYATASKMPYGAPVGVAALKEVCERVSLPVYSIGGIDKNNIKEVMAAGAAGVSLIRAILGAPNIIRNTKEIIHEIEIRRRSVL
ncbi:MAG: thiamine phosphate synthase [Deltaproteobacteria bacterium]|nr:thiamine phosphate synthase [Deltaproteobacteria bacterium]